MPQQQQWRKKALSHWKQVTKGQDGRGLFKQRKTGDWFFSYF